MSAWKLQAGRSITTPDGTFHLAYFRTTDGSNAPLFRDPAKLDAIARQVAALPELMAASVAMLAALQDALAYIMRANPPGAYVATDKIAAVLAKVQP